MPTGMLHRAESCGCEARIGMSKAHQPQSCDHGNLLVYVHGLRSASPTNHPSSSPQKQGGLKRRQPKRDWTAARTKVETEEVCRVCGSNVEVQAAHIIERSRDKFHLDGSPRDGVWVVEAVRIVPLCGPFSPLHCHVDFDSHAIDILQVLTLEEQVQAVRDAGSLVTAHQRTAPSSFQIVNEFEEAV